MDPNANLNEMRALAQRMLSHESDDIDDVDRLAELVVALDEFLSSGGFPPDAWNDVPKGILLSTETLSRWAGRDLDEADVHRLRREIPESDVPNVVMGLVADSRGDVCQVCGTWLDGRGDCPEGCTHRGEVVEEYRCAPGEGAPGAVQDTRLPYTVVGVWDEDESTPVPVGVVAGEHEVSGGDAMWFPAGLWATHVLATSAEEAEALAVDEMADTRGGDTDAEIGDDEAVEVTIRGHRFREESRGGEMTCLDHDWSVDRESGVEPAMQVGEHVGSQRYERNLAEEVMIAAGVLHEITGPTPTLAELGLPPVAEFKPTSTGPHRLFREVETELPDLSEMGGDEDWAGMERDPE